MRRLFAVLLVIALLMGTAALAGGGSQQALATDKLSLRDGPGTSYRDLGTYNVKGNYVTLSAKSWDSTNSIYWVYCTFQYKGSSISGWTGAKRFDAYSYDLYDLPDYGCDDGWYDDWYDDCGCSQWARAIDKLSLRDGPGTSYRDLGTYNVKGDSIELSAKSWDSTNSIYWVYCTFQYKGSAISGWTGAKRFDSGSYDIDDLPNW